MIDFTRQKRSIIIGGFVTAISTCVLFAFSIVVSSDAIRLLLFEQTNMWVSGNPFVQLRYIGGIPGGLVAGYVSKDYWGNDEWGTAMKDGMYAALVGLGLIYGAFVVYNVVRSILTSGLFPPPLYLITVVPLIYGIPLIPVYVLEALFAAVIGNGCRRVIRNSEMSTVEK